MLRLGILFCLISICFFSCKKEDNPTNNGTPTMTILVKDSLSGMPMEGVSIASQVYTSSQYGSFASYVSKSALTDEKGMAVLKFETKDEIYWYNYFLNRKELSILASAGNYYYREVQVNTSTPYPKTIKLIALPKYTFDFTNVTGDFLNDSLVFTCIHSTSPQSGGYWVTMYSQKTTGANFLTQPIILYTGYLLHTYYTIKYEFRTYPGGTLLASGWLPYAEDGTETHIPIEF